MEAAQRGFGSQSHSKVQLTLIILFKCDALRLVLRAGGHRSVPNMIDRDHTGQGRDGCILGELEVKDQGEVLSVVWWNKAEGGAYSSFSWSGRPEAPDDSDCAPTQSSSRETFWKALTPKNERKGAQKIFSSQTSQLPNPKSGPIQFRLLKRSGDTESKPTVPQIGKSLERNSSEAGRLFRTRLPSALSQVFPLGGALVPVHKTASALI